MFYFFLFAVHLFYLAPSQFQILGDECACVCNVCACVYPGERLCPGIWIPASAQEHEIILSSHLWHFCCEPSVDSSLYLCFSGCQSVTIANSIRLVWILRCKMYSISGTIVNYFFMAFYNFIELKTCTPHKPQNLKWKM